MLLVGMVVLIALALLAAVLLWPPGRPGETRTAATGTEPAALPPPDRGGEATRRSAGPLSVELPEACPASAPPAPPPPSTRREAAERFSAGTAASLVGNAGRAQSLYLEAARLDPTNAETAYRLGRMYEERGEDSTAARQYCRFLTLTASRADAADARARVNRLAAATAEPPPKVAAAEPTAPEAGASPSAPGRAGRPAERRAPAAAEPLPRLPPVAVEATPPATPFSAAPSTAADTRSAIRSAVAAYARAIESRDIARLRSAYPGLTAGQQAAWEDFFRNVRDLDARLEVEQVNVNGAVADVRVGGSYRYRNRSLGREESSPVVFRATLRREPDGWRVSSIR